MNQQLLTNRETLLVEALRQIQDYGDLSKNASPQRDLMVQLSGEDCSALARYALAEFDALTKGLKKFALICNTFGRKFSFHAVDQKDAESKARGWCRYHAFQFSDFEVQEIQPGGELQDLHNEWVDS